MRKSQNARQVPGTCGPCSTLYSSEISYSRSTSGGDRQFEELRFAVVDSRKVIVGYFDGASCREVFLHVVDGDDITKSLDLVWLEDQRWALVSHSWNYSDLPVPMPQIVEPKKAAELLLKRETWRQQFQPMPRELEQHTIGVRLSDDGLVDNDDRTKWTIWLPTKTVKPVFAAKKAVGKSPQAWTDFANRLRKEGLLKNHPIRDAKEIQIHKSVFTKFAIEKAEWFEQP